MLALKFFTLLSARLPSAQLLLAQLSGAAVLESSSLDLRSSVRKFAEVENVTAVTTDLHPNSLLP
jgi:hypothetical protein